MKNLKSILLIVKLLKMLCVVFVMVSHMVELQLLRKVLPGMMVQITSTLHLPVDISSIYLINFTKMLPSTKHIY